jgi:hypothetical protein
MTNVKSLTDAFGPFRNLRIGSSRVGLDFMRRGDRTFCNVVDVEGEKLLVNVGAQEAAVSVMLSRSKLVRVSLTSAYIQRRRASESFAT